MPAMIAAGPIADAAIASDGGGAFTGVIAVRGQPPRERDLEIWRGDTFQAVFRWSQEGWLSAPIVSITRGAFVRIVLGEEVAIPDGWSVAVVDAKGMTSLNAEIDPATLCPRERSLRQMRMVDPSTVEFNGISSAAFRPHAPGTGFLVWHPPVDLEGYTARLAMKTTYNGAELLPMLTTDLGTLVIDAEQFTTTAVLDQVVTAGLARDGIYDLEMVSPEGAVSKTHFGTVTVRNEVTTETP